MAFLNNVAGNLPLAVYTCGVDTDMIDAHTYLTDESQFFLYYQLCENHTFSLLYIFSIYFIYIIVKSLYVILSYINAIFEQDAYTFLGSVE